jgi:hypothetical protein
MDRTIKRSSTDQVESRRSQRARRESPTVSSRRTPPVQSRSEIGVYTVPLDSRPIPRRRVDLPLSTPGAEIRLPAVPVVNNKWRILSGVLTIGLLTGMILLTQSGLFKVTDLKMEGLERYTAGEISQAINITGSSIFFINPERVKEDLTLTYPGLSNVNVEVGWPAKVKIFLQERTPVLAWSWDGHVRWVDLNGVAFEPQNQDVKVIQVNSEVLPPTVKDRFVDPRIVDTVAVLSEYLPEDVELTYDTEHGLGWHDSRGWNVYFGLNDDDPRQKMNIYLALVDYLEGKRITPKVINVEYMDSPYFRMEE